MKHKYDNENDHSNDCRDHPRPSAKTGRKADDIAVCFIPPQNTHPQHPAADHVVSTLYAAVCRLSNVPLQYLRTHGQYAKKHPFGCFFCMFVPVHAPSFASMASQTSSMSPTMP